MKPLNDLRERYLDLMKNVLTDNIYGDQRVGHELEPRGGASVRNRGRSALINAFSRRGYAIVKKSTAQTRLEGSEWPAVAHTMVGMERLNHLQRCVEDVLARNVPGDLIETGVWRGGSCILMKAVLQAHGVTDRTVWVADSFQGLPPPNAEMYPADKGDRYHEADFLRVSRDQVADNFRKYGLLDARVEFLEGWFRDSLPRAPIKALAVLRFDGDMYESTWDVLTNLYDKVSPGGYVIIDDYFVVPGCKQAVHDFREKSGITAEIQSIANSLDGVYWIKP